MNSDTSDDRQVGSLGCAILAKSLSNCTGTACTEINKKLACTIPKESSGRKVQSVLAGGTIFCTVTLYKR